jgi:hypothetical protein
MFWEMLQVLCQLQTHQARVPMYILENVPLLGDTKVSCDGECRRDPVLDWTSGFIGCNEGWLACSSSTIMVDELIVEGGVEMNI